MSAVLKPGAIEDLATADVEQDAPQLAVAPLALRLRVDTGVQAGAHMDLTIGAELSIGGGRDDIRLRDHALGDARVLVTVGSDALMVRRVSGAVMAHDLPLGPSETIRLAVGDSIALGAVLLSVEASATEAASVADEVHDSDPAPLAVRADTDLQPAEAKRPAGRGLARAASVLLVVAAAGVGYFTYQAHNTPEALPSVAASILLEDERFAELVLSEQGGRVVIDGVLPDTASLAALDTWLRTHRVFALNRVETEASLATKTLDVLRVNGAEAQLVSSTAGTVQVATALPRDHDLDALVATVLADVPALQALKIDNTPPAAAPDWDADPGKRVAMVVSTDRPHIVTVDESRYFVGSVLPSGHRIEEIVDNRVTIVRGDERSVLDF